MQYLTSKEEVKNDLLMQILTFVLPHPSILAHRSFSLVESGKNGNIEKDFGNSHDVIN